mmetsp:Transcript_9549/g.19056  ORF Transcript_9549/g.19056 Transcript_9549/m.19056 type:complete len:203 (+) Transcript_9549:287-895(+)
MVTIFEKTYDKVLGSHEGVGILLRIARIDGQGTGTISDDEMKRLIASFSVMVDEILGFLSNSMVILTLALAVAVPCILHEVTQVEITSATFGAGDTSFYSFWVNPSAMHVFHWLECVLLACSIWQAMSGVFLCFILYSSLSLYLPDVYQQDTFLVCPDQAGARRLGALDGLAHPPNVGSALCCLEVQPCRRGLLSHSLPRLV